MFLDVPGCSGMFRNVPECSGMFHVPGFIDAPSPIPLLHACNKGNRRRLYAGKYFVDSGLTTPLN